MQWELVVPQGRLNWRVSVSSWFEEGRVFVFFQAGVGEERIGMVEEVSPHGVSEPMQSKVLS